MIKGFPVLKKQAYSTGYSWIMANGLLFKRELEIPLWLYLNGYDNSETDCIDKAIRAFDEDSGMLSYYGMVTRYNENLNKRRLDLLKNEKELCTINLQIPLNNNTVVYSTNYLAGVDYVLSLEECIALSKRMFVVCTDQSIISNEEAFVNANWNNIVCFRSATDINWLCKR